MHSGEPRIGLAILGWAACFGCAFDAARSLVSEPLPDEVEYVAFLFADGSGGIFETTGLMRRDPGQAIGVPLPEAIEEAAFVHLLGFREEDLSAIGFTAESASARLAIADPSEPALPMPIWYGTSRVSDGNGALQRASDPPFVTTAWIPPCPELVPERSTLVDSGCHQDFCGLVAEQSGCSFSISTEQLGCTPNRFEGRIDGSGRLVIPGCEAVDPNPGASAAIVCTDVRPFECKIEIHPRPAPPRLFVQSVTLFSDRIDPPAVGIAEVTIGGRIFGLEVFDDRILVVTDGGAAAWNSECPSPTPSTFHFLDPETLAQTGTASAPPCVRELARDPERDDEFFAIFGAEDARSVGRFSKQGRLLDSVAVPEAPGLDYPFALEVHHLSDRVSIALQNALGTQIHSFHRTPSLRFDWSSPLQPNLANHQELAENVISVVHRIHDVLHNIDLTRPPADPRSPFFPTNIGMTVEFRDVCEDILVRPERMLFIPGSGWLLGSQVGRTGWIAKLSLDGTDCDVVRWFQGESQIFDFALWPGDPNLVLVGVRAQADGRAYLTLMNRAEERFLTGSVEVGTGPIDDMHADSRGRVFMTLPWTGGVARAQMQ